jgi:predicted branched-subunit amino acid permease
LFTHALIATALTDPVFPVVYIKKKREEKDVNFSRYLICFHLSGGYWKILDI